MKYEISSQILYHVIPTKQFCYPCNTDRLRIHCISGDYPFDSCIFVCIKTSTKGIFRALAKTHEDSLPLLSILSLEVLKQDVCIGYVLNNPF